MGQTAISFSIDSRDIRFGLFDVLDVEKLCRFERFGSLDRERMEDVLTQAQRMAVEVLSPLNTVLDQDPPVFRDGQVIMPRAFHSAFRRFCEGGWVPLTLDRNSGGQGLPEVLGTAIKEMFNGACGGFYAISSLTLGALHLLERFGPESLKGISMDKMLTGAYTGTMCLTEPGAGSYLADMETRAVRRGDHYAIKGTKVFIGAGEHDLSDNIVHSVLARIEGAPEGYKGISLFAVPKYRIEDDGSLGPLNDVRCSGIERKMGWDGAPTASLHFGDEDDCRGWLMGQEGQGLAQMFHMINEMRLATGIQGVGQAAAAYGMALSFAKHRVQGLSHNRRKGDPLIQVPIVAHPDIRRNLLFMKAVVEGCRRLAVQTALWLDLSKVLEDEKDRQYCRDLVEILTPVCKAYATDMGFRVAETAVQSMGGYGYIKDYKVEQYLRDLKVACIYEGTNGIQAIDLQRRKLTLHDGRLFRNLLGEIEAFIHENTGHPVLAFAVRELQRAKEAMRDAARSLSGRKEQDPGLALCAAKPFLDLTGHLLCTWMLLKTARVAAARLEESQLSDKVRTFLQGKIHTAHFAVSNLLPQVHALAETVSAGDRSVLDMDGGAF